VVTAAPDNNAGSLPLVAVPTAVQLDATDGAVPDPIALVPVSIAASAQRRVLARASGGNAAASRQAFKPPQRVTAPGVGGTQQRG
jgi:hypothetical protein